MFFVNPAKNRSLTCHASSMVPRKYSHCVTAPPLSAWTAHDALSLEPAITPSAASREGRRTPRACPAAGHQAPRRPFPMASYLLFTAASLPVPNRHHLASLSWSLPRTAPHIFPTGAPALLGRETDETFINHLVKSPLQSLFRRFFKKRPACAVRSAVIYYICEDAEFVLFCFRFPLAEGN